MNPSGRGTQPIGLSGRTYGQTANSQRMTSCKRFQPYNAAQGQSFVGSRLPQGSSATHYDLPAPSLASSGFLAAQGQASSQNVAFQSFNNVNVPANHQNRHLLGPRPASPKSVAPQAYSRPGASNGAATYLSNGTYPSQPWQPSQRMIGAGGDAFSPVGLVKQGKAMVEGNPPRSQGLRVLSGRVGKVSQEVSKLKTTRLSR